MTEPQNTEVIPVHDASNRPYRGGGCWVPCVEATPATLRRAQYSAYLDPLRRLTLARSILRSKLRSQQRSLALWGQDLPEAVAFSGPFLRRVDLARNVGELLGVEGASGKVYFDLLRQILPPSLKFDGRNRRPPRDPVNALLSYGNSLVYALVTESLRRVPLAPAVGFLHEPAPGRNPLALDVAESIKPLTVDPAVVEVTRPGIWKAWWTEATEEGCRLVPEARRLFRERVLHHASPGGSLEPRGRMGWPRDALKDLDGKLQRMVLDLLEPDPQGSWAGDFFP